MIYKSIVFVLTLHLVVSFSLPLQATVTQNSVPPGDEAIAIFSNTLYPEVPSAIQSITTTSTEVSDEKFVESALAAAVDGKVIDAVTFIEPDISNAVSPMYFSATNQIFQKMGAPLRQRLKVSTRNFGDWFSKNRFRLSIIVTEVAITGSVKFTELTISPQPVEHAAALACGILSGALIGSIEWHSPKIMSLIKNTSTPVKEVIDRVSRLAQENKRSKIQTALTTAWQYTKNTGINIAVFSAFKFLLYATTNGGDSGLQTALEAFRAFSPDELLNSAKLAAAATAVSFPTTKVIIAYMTRATSQANGEPSALLKVRDRVTLFASSALTARVLLFSSLMVAARFDWPTLNTVAIGGLGAMFVGSIWKLVSNAKRDQRELKCSLMLAPSEP